MSRGDAARLNDMLAGIAAIRRHLARGDLADGLVFDAVRMRLVEIGEAAKGVTAELVAREPNVPWREIAGMRGGPGGKIAAR